MYTCGCKKSRKSKLNRQMGMTIRQEEKLKNYRIGNLKVKKKIAQNVYNMKKYTYNVCKNINICNK